MTKNNGIHSERLDVDEHDVRQLLEQAERRPEIPPAYFRVIKAAAHQEWRQLVEAKKSRIRWRAFMTPLPAAAGILVVAGLAFWWRSASVPTVSATIASIELSSGDVWIEEQPGESARESQPASGDNLGAGVELVTGSGIDDPPALIAVRLANGQSVRLHPGSRARLVSPTHVELLKGAVYVDSGDAQDLEGIEIFTAFGTVFDVGTQFEVRMSETEETLRVRVRSGSISLVREAGTHSATIGEELRVDGDGVISRGTYNRSGADWDWILSAAPALDIEGQPLNSFLDWVSDETGLEITYEDQVLAGAATTIELHGTIEGLRPDEALVAVLPGTGLDHQIDGGRLIIRRRPLGSGGV